MDPTSAGRCDFLSHSPSPRAIAWQSRRHACQSDRPRARWLPQQPRPVQCLSRRHCLLGRLGGACRVLARLIQCHSDEGEMRPVSVTRSRTRLVRCVTSEQHARLSRGRCEAGKYTGTPGNTACLDCTTGYLCVEGASAPQPCSGGTHANQTVLQLDGFLSSLDQCIICPEGTFCSVGSAQPTPCAPGTFNALPQQPICLKCDPGTYQNEEGTTACKTCTGGNYCGLGAAAALPCPAGTRQNQSLAVMTSVSQCITCDAGYACSVGSPVQSPCLPGSYGGSSGQATCSLCQPGKYTPDSANTVCRDCTPGYLCVEGSSAPQPW